MIAARNRRPAALAALSLAGTIGLVLALTRPEAPRPASQRVTEVVREPDEQAPARDEENHYAPGSPAAVAERFLRAWLRYHYDDAAAFATGSQKARCDRNVTLFRQMDPDTRERVRQEQIVAEAAQFDLEQAVTEELPPADGGVPRRRVRGTVHAHGVVRGHTAENRREQALVLHLVEGAWRVAEWTPGRAADGGIVVH